MRSKFEMSVAKYGKALWQLARPLTLVVMLLHGALAYVLLTHALPAASDAILGVAVLVLAYVHAAAINDLSDEEVDKINLAARHSADRPLVNKTTSRRQLVLVIACVSVIAIACATAIAWWLALVTLVVLLLNCVYSLAPFRLSGRGALAQLFLPLMYVGFPVCIAVALAGIMSPLVVYAAISMYVVFVGRLFLKDIRDEKGDRQTGKRTYIVRHGLRATLVQSGVWIVCGSWLLQVVLTVYYFGVSGYVLLPVLLLGNAMTIWALWKCFAAKKLDVQLLFVAIVGRASTMWIFCVLVWVMLIDVTTTTISKYTFLALGVGIFIFGIVALYEEILQIYKS